MHIRHSEKSFFSTDSSSFVLDDLLLVPNSYKYLISTHRSCLDNDVYIHFDAQKVLVIDLSNKEDVLQGEANGGLYQLPIQIKCTEHAPLCE